jgi:hypothetical protein
MDVLNAVRLLVSLFARWDADFGGRVHGLAGVDGAAIGICFAAGDARPGEESASGLPADLVELLLELGQARARLLVDLIVCVLSFEVLQVLLQLLALLDKRIAQV